ncbi:glycosyltransferase [Streptacidiphilus neutrinimicus]|uniref:glycosyltransferase n=1 Tax=Streptacidiphilus neutrinimicus TaxID=105420 RepID=UPI00069375D0|nr:glycosyltransferase [Streptacidiphilus neutrinimicus]
MNARTKVAEEGATAAEGRPAPERAPGAASGPAVGRAVGPAAGSAPAPTALPNAGTGAAAGAAALVPAQAGPAGPGQPDVTVIVAVYNTMPYLSTCLESLLAQTLGTARMQIVTVDDGSTDGSGEALDAFAAEHPGLVDVVHQANSGGPAAPSNRGLELARGRYVFFLGADDHLGPEALERLVAAADTHGTDVVVGRMVGLNGRWVPKAAFQRQRHDATLGNSPLAWALSNTKLFRRALIERLGLRYDEDLPVLSDQPFTLAALFAAGPVSILNDYDYYYAVRRYNAGNITYRGGPEPRLLGTERIMALTGRLADSPEALERVHRRHLEGELADILGPALLELDREAQERIVSRVGVLVAAHASDDLLLRVPVAARIRLLLARAGEVDAVLAALRFEQADRRPPLLVRGERALLDHPALGDARLGIDERFFETDDSLTRLDGLTAELALDARRRPCLTLTAHSPLPGYGGPVARVWVETFRSGGAGTAGEQFVAHQALVSYAAAPDGGTVLTARVPLGLLLRQAHLGAASGPWSVRLRLHGRASTGGRTHEIQPVRCAKPVKLRAWRGPHLFRVSANVGAEGELQLSVGALSLVRSLKRRLRPTPRAAQEGTTA